MLVRGLLIWHKHCVNASTDLSLPRYCVDAPGFFGPSAHTMDKNAMYEAKVSAIRNAQVVCCTCIASGGGVLERFHFSRVLVDEATQATEPSTIVPLCLGAEQVVLVAQPLLQGC